MATITSIAGDAALGVYQANGRQVVGGAESGPSDVYLYTFEVASLADQLGRGAADYSSFDQEAALLNALHVTLNGASVTGPALEAAVTGGLRRLSAKGSTPADRLGLIVRDLGTRRHINWSRPPASSAPILDPLQRLFILIDIVRPLIHSGAKAGHARVARAAFVPGAQEASPCEGNFSGPTSGIAIGGRFALGVFKTGPGVLTQFLLDGVMGTAFAYSFHVSAVNEHGNDTNFGTHGPGSGTPLDLRVKTEMLDDLSSTVINCGSLIGYTVPGKGPLSGVTINWDEDKLPSLGTVTCGSPCTTTNNDGIATLHYQPYDEYLPGQGPLVVTRGIVTANAYPSRSNGNILAAVLEALGVNKYAFFAYSVGYHDPGGYRVEIPAISTQGSDFGDAYSFTDYFTNMEACTVSSAGWKTGGNPLAPVPSLGATPASNLTSGFREHEVIQYPQGGTSDNPQAYVYNPVALQMGGLGYPLPSNQTDYGEDNTPAGGAIGGLNVSGMWILDTTGLQAVITADRQGVSPGAQSFDLPVTRATDCPPTAP